VSTDISRYPSSSSDGFSQGSRGVEATQALDELRLEVLKTQQAVEEIRAALGPSPIPDYTPSLAAIVQGITHINGELKQFKEHPALKLTPADYHRALTQSGHVAMRNAIDQLTETREAAHRTQQAPVNVLGVVLSRQQQARWMAIVAGVALVAGLLSSPLLTRLLPFGLNTRVAALVMASDRWQAGARLMQVGNPAAWATVEQATTLWQLNRDEFHACELAAGKRQSIQQCTVFVPPP
jgi:hypothetical protein